MGIVKLLDSENTNPERSITYMGIQLRFVYDVILSQKLIIRIMI